MKRRFTLAILGTVAVSLLLVGVGTLLFARVGARKATEDDLRSQAESTAQLVDLGQTTYGQLNAADYTAIQNLVCGQPAPASGTPTTRVGVNQLRAAYCSSPTPNAALNNAKRALCDNPLPRLDQTLTENLRTEKDEFCARPDLQSLEELRSVYCTNVDNNQTGSGTPRRSEQVRTNICTLTSVRNESRQDLQETLSKESIKLVEFDASNDLVQGELPPGLKADDLRPDRLRESQIVSGSVDNGLFAAAAVDSTAPNLQVIVIARPSDPLKGVLPWFLLASGITLLIGALVAASLSRALTHPLREATNVTARIADGDLTSRLPEQTFSNGKRHDELDELAHSINTMAQALERSRGLERQFLLSVSHDLRTPLTSIRGYAEAIADGAAPDAPRAASIILSESRRLERLVKDLLDLAKLDARRFTMHLSLVDLNEIADDSVAGFRREVDQAGLTIVLSANPTATAAYADSDRLQQVIANLIENAVKYASTTITVTVAADAEGPRIEVADDGHGIADQDLPHVFERLYVASAEPERKEAGSGLGLAIVRELLEAMGGHIRAEANPSGGARMVVTLPTTPPPLPPQPPV